MILINTKYVFSDAILTKKGGDSMNQKVTVMEISVKVFLLREISQKEVQQEIAHFIDSSMATEPELLELHNKNQYSGYVFDNLYPPAQAGVYEKEQVYTFRIRTIDASLGQYFLRNLKNHLTNDLKGLTTEVKKIPKKIIEQIYSLTPCLLKTEQGYWKNTLSILDFEKRLFVNLIKKYKQFTGIELDVDFQFYTGINFINRTPIKSMYKSIHLLTDKVSLQVADNSMAQELAYFALGVGLAESNARGFGFCNYRWL